MRSSIRTYSGRLDGSPGWSMQEVWRFAIVDRDAAYSNEEIGADVNIGDFLIRTDDGTKIIQVRGHKAIVIYFGLRDTPSTFFTVTMPSAPDAALSSALERKALCVFVCGPLEKASASGEMYPMAERMTMAARNGFPLCLASL